MNDRKQYAKKVVINIIHFMAQASASIFPDKETAEKALNEIPEEFHREIMASLKAAREIKKVDMLTKLASAFPLGDILEKAMKEAKEKSEED